MAERVGGLRRRAAARHGRRAAIAAAALAAAASGCGGGEQRRPADPFQYRAGGPVAVRVTSVAREGGGVTARHLTFPSARGGAVPATLLAPRPSRLARPALILQHGMPGNRVGLLPEAAELARLGVVVLLIDAPFARRSGPPVRFDLRDRAEQLQYVVDLRRAVDVLVARPDVDEHRIGYVGISHGGAIGALLAGVERRIRAFALVVADGGLVEHFAATAGDDPAVPGLGRRQARRWVEAMRPIEPLRYVRRARAALLLQSGRHDRSVRPASAARLHRAAPRHSDVRWYAAGHSLGRRAECDRVRWLGRRLRFDGSAHASCREPARTPP